MASHPVDMPFAKVDQPTCLHGPFGPVFKLAYKQLPCETGLLGMKLTDCF